MLSKVPRNLAQQGHLGTCPCKPSRRRARSPRQQYVQRRAERRGLRGLELGAQLRQGDSRPMNMLCSSTAPGSSGLRGPLHRRRAPQLPAPPCPGLAASMPATAPPQRARPRAHHGAPRAQGPGYLRPAGGALGSSWRLCTPGAGMRASKCPSQVRGCARALTITAPGTGRASLQRAPDCGKAGRVMLALGLRQWLRTLPEPTCGSRLPESSSQRPAPWPRECVRVPRRQGRRFGREDTHQGLPPVLLRGELRRLRWRALHGGRRRACRCH